MHKITIKVRVRMEPELEEIAGHLNARERREFGLKIGRWQKQLFLSARIMEIDARPRLARRWVPKIQRAKLLHN